MVESSESGVSASMSGEIESLDLDLGDDDESGEPLEPLEHDDNWAKLLGWFVANRLAVFVLALLIALAGVWASPFVWDTGPLPRSPVPVDAIPDVGENQQIVFSEWPGRSPRDIEDQITYPLTTALLGIPAVKTVRSASAFGFSTIYVIFEDDAEFYWARSRVLEKLASLQPGTVPEGVSPTLGPDATALGQVFWYTLEGHDPATGELVGGWDLHELRSIQDWTLRFALQSVSGVSEVASIGGFVREYQVDVDPEALRAQGVTLDQVARAVAGSNLDVGARTLEINQVEYLIRSVGFIEDQRDIEEAVVVSHEHTPIRVRDVARVSMGPAQRRGALDDAGAEVVGGVVVARYGANPLETIEAVKQRIAEIQAGLPRKTLANGRESQVTVVPFYDRTELIHETLDTLSTALWQEILVTIIVVLVLLRDLRSSLLISAMLPLGVLATFVVMKLTGVDANVMALGGIAIAIGTMVDIGIVLTENIATRLQAGAGAGSIDQRAQIVRRAASEVAPAVVTSVLTTVVSFLPVFGLTASESRLFTPLALTKTYAMVGALGLSLLILPALALVLMRPQPTKPAHPRGGPGRRALASMLRWVHLRDWVLAGLGLALLMWVHVGLGLLVLAMAGFRLARPLLPKQAVTVGVVVENVLAIIVVALALTRSWLPLGPAPGVAVNALFVGGIVGGVVVGLRAFMWLYPALLRVFLRHKLAFMLAPALVVLLGATVWLGALRVFGWAIDEDETQRGTVATTLVSAAPGFGREYMPPFDEGAFLYMPTTMPHASLGQALEMLQQIDAAIAAIPEVDRVVGKLGRVDSALDPAPVSMIETVITYVPEYRIEADGSRVRQWRDQIRTTQDIWDEIVAAAQMPGLTSAPVLMPINARIVMLQSGMRAPMGIKIAGPDLESIERFGLALEPILRDVPELRAETVFADRVVGKPYLELELDRREIAHQGLTIAEVQHQLQVALGGMVLTRTVEGRERYGVRVRYMREDRDSLPAIERLPIAVAGQEPIPLGQLAQVRYVRGPQMIKAEDTFATAYVLFDRVAEVAEVEAVEAAHARIEAALASGELVLPDGVSYRFSGSYENQLRSEARLLVLIPVALALVFILLHLRFRRVAVTVMIYSGVAVAVSGGFLLLWAWGQPGFMDFELLGTNMGALLGVGPINLSVAVWVGVIALIGIATDDGVVMATYLSQKFASAPPRTVQEIRARTLDAGKRRVRPCLMTTATTLLALMPVVASQGRGGDVMAPMAVPILGGMLIELLTLFVVPVLWCWMEEIRFARARRAAVVQRVGPNRRQPSVRVRLDEPVEAKLESSEDL
ncbi:Cobalt-zinc-cadmium resistance protein CzcA [Enhygromyxa salina]|uniref:Cobalt-zinc-cadmium resistance protein CzcA n=1 Tax=Enhygromyxa salina TaxID=215803 RepID=A0A0C2CXU9_9BACT|nr:efflux RND transporter permease subunit [Enhygromyxa salina]KIG14465.1 Cobalt-zinc-cadmium resistance protein CzcA [Enhygromyxa salina]